MALERRTPLKSGSSLKRTGLQRGKGLKSKGDGLRRQPLKSKTGFQQKKPMPRSGVPLDAKKPKAPRTQIRPKPKPVSPEERSCREVVSIRSGQKCEICGRGGIPLEKAHRVARSQQGAWNPANVLDLCNRCHHWNHAHPKVAYAQGWHLRQGSDPCVEPVSMVRSVQPEHFDQSGALWDPCLLPLESALLGSDGTLTWLEDS